MSNLISQCLLGIVSGILTTALLYLAKGYWDAKITPFLAKLRYQGVEIDGAWTGKNEIGEIKNECDLFLNQNAHELSGSFLLKFESPGKSFNINFNVTGYMWEGYVTLNFVPKDKRITSYATCLLKLHGGGHQLIGDFLFRNVEEEIVSSLTLSLARTEA